MYMQYTCISSHAILYTDSVVQLSFLRDKVLVLSNCLH